MNWIIKYYTKKVLFQKNEIFKEEVRHNDAMTELNDELEKRKLKLLKTIKFFEIIQHEILSRIDHFFSEI